MRMHSYYTIILAFVIVASAYGSSAPSYNASSNSSAITGYSTIITNVSVVMPNYQKENLSFVVFPLSNVSSLTTLELLNQSSFARYNFSVSMLNNTGYPPFAGQILITPTINTPVNTYQIDLKAVGGMPSNYTLVVNVSILNSSVYNNYLKIQKSIRGIVNGSNVSGSTVSTVPVSQQTTAIQNITSSAQTSAYFNTTTIATTIATTSGQGSGYLTYVGILAILLVIIVAAYFLLKNRKR